jgi:hypothetical protein
MAGIWTQDDADALKEAIKTGVLTVTYGATSSGSGRSVTYQSLSQMRALLASMLQDIAQAGGTSSTRYAATRKGFCL